MFCINFSFLGLYHHQPLPIIFEGTIEKKTLFNIFFTIFHIFQFLEDTAKINIYFPASKPSSKMSFFPLGKGQGTSEPRGYPEEKTALVGADI